MSIDRRFRHNLGKSQVGVDQLSGVSVVEEALVHLRVSHQRLHEASASLSEALRYPGHPAPRRAARSHLREGIAAAEAGLGLLLELGDNSPTP
jgi:hypothetical protein